MVAGHVGRRCLSLLFGAVKVGLLALFLRGALLGLLALNVHLLLGGVAFGLLVGAVECILLADQHTRVLAGWVVQAGDADGWKGVGVEGCGHWVIL